MDMNDIKRAVAYAGGQRGLARLIEVNERTVRRWVAGKILPGRLASAAIRRVLKLAVDRQGICPTVSPSAKGTQ